MGAGGLVKAKVGGEKVSGAKVGGGNRTNDNDEYLALRPGVTPLLLLIWPPVE